MGPRRGGAAVMLPSKDWYTQKVKASTAFASVGAKLTRRPSDLLPRPGTLLQRFHDLVTSHDVDAVSDFVARLGPDELDLNGQNYQGHAALHLAVINEDQPMVERLLEIRPRLAVGNALLHAVLTGNQPILEMALAHKKAIEEDGSAIDYWFLDCTDFTPDITPLMLAAHTDNFVLVRLLLENGHTIDKPHPADCQCSEKCRLGQEKETLSESVARINAYKAIASPSYISLTSSDPILEAFELNQDLEDHAEREPEFKDDYMKLAKQCSKFAVDLLDNCRTTDEVVHILNRRSSFEVTAYKEEKFTRVNKAVDYDLKEFVTHPNCQQVLCAEWLQDFTDFRSVRMLGMCYLIIHRIILYPFMATLHWMFPWSEKARSFQTPINKYLNNAASYFVFLTLILAQNYFSIGFKSRGPPVTGLEYIIIIFVLAMWLKNLRYLWAHGLQRYLQLAWNIYDCVMLVLFSATFVCWALSAYEVATNIGSSRWPRVIWNQWDPCLIGEVFYGIAIISAFFKLLFFFQFNSSIGMLQVSMSRMVADTTSFLAILATIIASFAVGLFSIYQPYRGYTRRKDDEVTVQSEAFTGLFSAMMNLYWGFFGYTPPSYAQVVLPEEKVVIGNQTVYVYNEHYLTETVGIGVLAVYYLFCVVVLMNMLIAMLTNAYTNVLLNADMEWKFNRTKIWMSFFVSEDHLPVPFNLLPNPVTFYQHLVWVVTYIGQKFNRWSAKEGKPEVNARFNCIRCCYFEEKDALEEEQNEVIYQNLMSMLIQRYFTSRSDIRKEPPMAAFMANINSQLKDLTAEVKQLRQQMVRSSFVAESAKPRIAEELV